MESSQTPQFSGEPKLYRRLTIVGPIVMNLYLYLGMVGLLYGVHDQEWILGWKPVLVMVLFTALLIRISYPWIMNLDARYGTGSGWKLESQSIKLPERRARS